MRAMAGGLRQPSGPNGTSGANCGVVRRRICVLRSERKSHHTRLMPALASHGAGSTSEYSSSSVDFLASEAPGLGARHSISRTFLPLASVMVSFATSLSTRFDLRYQLIDVP